jgi:Protein of unknown function (DUF4230)
MAIIETASRRGSGCLAWAIMLSGALLSLAIVFGGTIKTWFSPNDPETVVAASLEGLREQNVLVPFTARYVAVVTSRQTTLGITAQKTLILPGTVRYEVDLGSLRQSDLDWDAGTSQLTVTLPPLRLAGPEIALSDIREYRDGELLLWLTDAEQRLDTVNERAGQRELLRQARGEVPLRLARGAAIRAVEQSFAMPLRAAGVEAEVTVRFRNQP